MTSDERKEYKLRMKEAKKEAKRMVKKTKRENKAYARRGSSSENDYHKEIEHKNNVNSAIAILMLLLVVGLIGLFAYRDSIIPFIMSLVNSFK